MLEKAAKAATARTAKQPNGHPFATRFSCKFQALDLHEKGAPPETRNKRGPRSNKV